MTRSSSNPFAEALLVGAGPVGAALVPILSRNVDLVTRLSPRGWEFSRQLASSRGQIIARSAEKRFKHLEGAAKARRFFLGYQGLKGDWRAIFLCTPADRYGEAIASLSGCGALRPGQTLILMSAGFGSGALAAEGLRRAGLDPRAFTVVSLSNYFAATKHPVDSAGFPRRTEVLHRGLKRRVYAGFSRPDPAARRALRDFFAGVKVDVAFAPGTLAAESRNITGYVHPPLFINAWSLKRILSLDPPPGHMYKVHPRGPITRQRLKAMARLTAEINVLLLRIGIEPLNLLKFLNDDNYPLPEATLPRSDIEGFERRSLAEKAFLLYKRYAALQAGPFENFSDVPFPRPARLGPGRYALPRVPLEDFKTLLVFQRLGTRLKAPTPTINALCSLFQRSVRAFEREEAASASVDFAKVGRERRKLADLILKRADA